MNCDLRVDKVSADIIIDYTLSKQQSARDEICRSTDNPTSFNYHINDVWLNYFSEKRRDSLSTILHVNSLLNQQLHGPRVMLAAAFLQRLM